MSTATVSRQMEILSFYSRFGDVLELPPLSFEDFDGALLHASSGSALYLGELHTALLKNLAGRKGTNVSNWTTQLRLAVGDRMDAWRQPRETDDEVVGGSGASGEVSRRREAENPLVECEYDGLDVGMKLRLLQVLCDWQFSESTELRGWMRAPEQRKDVSVLRGDGAIGSDSSRKEYYVMKDDVGGVRLFRGLKLSACSELVCSSLEDVMQLAEQFAATTSSRGGEHEAQEEEEEEEESSSSSSSSEEEEEDDDEETVGGLAPFDTDAACGECGNACFIGRRVRRRFGDGRIAGGAVVDEDEEEGTKRPIFGVRYDDGDTEDFYSEELQPVLTHEEWMGGDEWRCGACIAAANERALCVLLQQSLIPELEIAQRKGMRRQRQRAMKQRTLSRQLGAANAILAEPRRARRAPVDYSSASYDRAMDAALADAMATPDVDDRRSRRRRRSVEAEEEEEEAEEEAPGGGSWVGRRVSTDFGTDGIWRGVVVRYSSSHREDGKLTQLYVKYADGESLWERVEDESVTLLPLGDDGGGGAALVALAEMQVADEEGEAAAAAGGTEDSSHAGACSGMDLEEEEEEEFAFS